jgi:hypothetical protein
MPGQMKLTNPVAGKKPRRLGFRKKKEAQQGRGGERLVYCPLCYRGPFTEAGLRRHVCEIKAWWFPRHQSRLTANERSRAIPVKGGAS